MRQIICEDLWRCQKDKKDKILFYIRSIFINLKKQIYKSFLISDDYRKDDYLRIEEKAQNVCLEFIKTIPKILKDIKTDIQASYNSDPAANSVAEIVFSYPGLYATIVNRIAHQLYVMDVPLIPRMMAEYAHSITGIDIHPGASIGKSFFIDHGTGIVIGETTIIGNNVKIYHNVTLGAISTKGGQLLKGIKRHPTIKDNVVIYSGVSILGGGTVVGKNVVIGSGSFITESIPENTKVNIKKDKLIVERRC